MPTRLLQLMCLLVLSACGATELDGLTGEPPSVAPLTTPAQRRTHPAVDAVQRFIVAVSTDGAPRAWQLLSADTRKALQTRATPAGLQGVDLLRLRKLPAGDSLAKGVAFDPVAAFALTEIKTLQVVAAGARDEELQIELTDQRGGKKTVQMRFEGYRWRIHKPEFAP